MHDHTEAAAREIFQKMLKHVETELGNIACIKREWLSDEAREERRILQILGTAIRAGLRE